MGPYGEANVEPLLPITPEQVAADPVLREAARALADLYLADDGYLTRWLAGADHTPIPQRAFVADLIDADHVIDFRNRWVALLGGAEPHPCDEAEPWLIDRPWETDEVPGVVQAGTPGDMSSAG